MRFQISSFKLYTHSVTEVSNLKYQGSSCTQDVVTGLNYLAYEPEAEPFAQPGCQHFAVETVPVELRKTTADHL